MDDVSVWIEVFPLLSERSRRASAPSRSYTFSFISDRLRQRRYLAFFFWQRSKHPSSI